MIELSKLELDGLLIFNKKTIGIYFYTPLCGTCKLATKMLEVTLEVLPEVDIYKCNVNVMSPYVQQWQIQSVPCLVIINHDQVLKKEYALQSVSYLYSVLAPIRKLNQ